MYYSKKFYRKDHKIENLFSRLKDWRPIATRYDRCVHAFRSAILTLVRHCSAVLMPLPNSSTSGNSTT